MCALTPGAVDRYAGSEVEGGGGAVAVQAAGAADVAREKLEVERSGPTIVRCAITTAAPIYKLQEAWKTARNQCRNDEAPN
jgi:uncharacterized membrane protein